MLNRAMNAFQREVHEGRPHRQSIWSTGRRAAVDTNSIADFLGWVPMTSGQLGPPEVIIGATVDRLKASGMSDEQIAEVIERAM